MKITLKQARKMKDFSQGYVAKCLGIHVDTYRKIENDTELATVAQVKQIANIIGIPYDEIFF